MANWITGIIEIESLDGNVVATQACATNIKDHVSLLDESYDGSSCYLGVEFKWSPQNRMEDACAYILANENNCSIKVTTYEWLEDGSEIESVILFEPEEDEEGYDLDDFLEERCSNWFKLDTPDKVRGLTDLGLCNHRELTALANSLEEMLYLRLGGCTITETILFFEVLDTHVRDISAILPTVILDKLINSLSEDVAVARDYNTFLFENRVPSSKRSVQAYLLFTALNITLSEIEHHTSFFEVKVPSESSDLRLIDSCMSYAVQLADRVLELQNKEDNQPEYLETIRAEYTI